MSDAYLQSQQSIRDVELQRRLTRIEAKLDRLLVLVDYLWGPLPEKPDLKIYPLSPQDKRDDTL